MTKRRTVRVNKKPRSSVSKRRASQTRVFISFKYEERYLKNYLKGQLRNKRTKVAASDWSLKEGVEDKNWRAKALRQIKHSDQVIVVLGKRTSRSAGVRQEVAIARKLGKKVCQVKPASSRGSKPVPGAGRQYMWNQKNLRKILRG